MWHGLASHAGDGLLSRDELKIMIRHAKYARREPHSDEDVEKAVAELEEKVAPPIAFGAFRNAIMAGKLRGSSSLWRVGRSPFDKPKPKGYYGGDPRRPPRLLSLFSFVFSLSRCLSMGWLIVFFVCVLVAHQTQPPPLTSREDCPLLRLHHLPPPFACLFLFVCAFFFELLVSFQDGRMDDVSFFHVTLCSFEEFVQCAFLSWCLCCASVFCACFFHVVLSDLLCACSAVDELVLL